MGSAGGASGLLGSAPLPSRRRPRAGAGDPRGGGWAGSPCAHPGADSGLQHGVGRGGAAPALPGAWRRGARCDRATAALGLPRPHWGTEPAAPGPASSGGSPGGERVDQRTRPRATPWVGRRPGAGRDLRGTWRVLAASRLEEVGDSFPEQASSSARPIVRWACPRGPTVLGRGAGGGAGRVAIGARGSEAESPEALAFACKRLQTRAGNRELRGALHPLAARPLGALSFCSLGETAFL